MLSTRSWAAFSLSERQAFKSRWLRSGQCLRCFHASLRAEEGEPAANADKSQLGIAPKRGLTRKERASMISDEVSKLQQRQSSSNESIVRKTHGPTFRKDGGSFVQQDHRHGRGADSGDGMLRGSSLAAAMETSNNAHKAPVQRSTQISAKRFNRGLAAPSGAQFNPREISKDELLHHGGGSATIANNNFEGVVEDHLNAVVEPGRQGPTDSLRAGAKFWQRQLIRLTPELRTEWATKPEKIQQKNGKVIERRRRFKRVPAEVEKALSERMVKGVYDADGILEGNQKYRQPLLNDVSKRLLLNTTFLADDRARLLNKVQSLLPAATAAAGKQAPKQKGA